MINAAPHLAEQHFCVIENRMNSNIIFVRSSVTMVNSVRICYNIIHRAFFAAPANAQLICCTQAKQ